MMRGEEDADGRVEVKEERPMCTRRGNRKKIEGEEEENKRFSKEEEILAEVGI